MGRLVGFRGFVKPFTSTDIPSMDGIPHCWVPRCALFRHAAALPRTEARVIYSLCRPKWQTGTYNGRQVPTKAGTHYGRLVPTVAGRYPMMAGRYLQREAGTDNGRPVPTMADGSLRLGGQSAAKVPLKTNHKT